MGSILQIGAVAGAIGSILALIFTVGHLVGSGDGGKKGSSSTAANADPFRGLVLSVPRDGVHRFTVADFLAWRGFGRSSAPPGEANKRGVAVQYRIVAPHYPKGRSFFLRFTLVHLAGSTEPTEVTRDDAPEAQVLSEHCGCQSPFLPLHHSGGKFRVDVSIYRDASRTGAAAVVASSLPFTVS